jgi:hypothetical protein
MTTTKLINQHNERLDNEQHPLCSDNDANTGMPPCSPQRVAVITAITGRMDDPKTMPPQTVEHTFHFFNDKHVPVEYRHLNKRTQALYFKQQMHKLVDADVYIWIDAKVQVDGNDFVEQCLTELGDNDIAILKHGERDCVYDELNYIIEQTEAGRPYFVARFSYRLEKIKATFSVLRDEYTFPIHAGLGDCSVMVWRNNEMTRAIQNNWWKTCSEADLFDQVEIRFLIHAFGLSYTWITFTPGTFHLVKHKRVQ